MDCGKKKVELGDIRCELVVFVYVEKSVKKLIFLVKDLFLFVKKLIFLEYALIEISRTFKHDFVIY